MQNNKEMKFLNIGITETKAQTIQKKLRNIIKDKTNQLKIYPFTGKKLFSENIRTLVFKNYSLVRDTHLCSRQDNKVITNY